MDAAHHAKITARMARIDAYPKEIRELIHEEGLTVVQAFLDQKITSPAAIRHLINKVRTGSLDTGTAIGAAKNDPPGRWMCTVPMEPTPAMIEASMATVTNNDVLVDKYEKHRRRIRAAIKAGMSRVV